MAGMKRILHFVLFTLMIVSTIGTATAKVRRSKHPKESEKVLTAKPGPAIPAPHIKPERKQAGATTPEGHGPASHPGPPPFGPPVEISMKRAKSVRIDLRSLPQAPPRKFERPEREEPFIDRAVIQPGVGAAQEVMTPSVPPRNAPAPPPIMNFDGLDNVNWGAGHPPDTNGDVGPTYYIQTINTSIGIYRKSDGVSVAAFTFDTFMSQGNFGNLCDTNNFGDPVVLYDSFEDRWIITDFAFTLDGSSNVINPPGNFQCVAASMTGDPVSGGWNFYSINTAGGLGDYPKLGIWPDGLYMSVNMFDYAAAGSFQGSREYAFNKAQMYAGEPSVQVVTFNAPTADFTILPSNARLQAGTPPAGTPNYFLSSWEFTNALTVYKFHVDWNSISASTFTGPDVPNATTSWPSATPANAPSLGGNALDVLAIRAMVQNQYTNLGGVESLWATHTVPRFDTSGFAAPRWYQVDVTGGAVNPAIPQAATWDPDGANVINRFMPSVAVDRAGNMALGYSTSDSTTKPALKYAGRLSTDPVNTLGQTESVLIQGAGTQLGNCGGTCTRWGDYSAMTLDPDGCTFWYTNEYYAVDGLNYLTRIGSFKFPSCTSVGAGGTVSGTVTATTGGAPISGATIQLGARSTTTNGSGSYSFLNIPAGTYPTITATFPGYITASASSIVVTDGGTTTRNFSLATAPTSACLTDTTQADFQTGLSSNVDVTTTPGAVILLSTANIDQQNTSLTGSGFGFNSTAWFGQSFTAGVTGQLTAVDVDLFCSTCTGTTPNITVSIRAATVGDLPTGADLATATIPGFSSGSGGFFTATFGSPPTLTAATKYTIVVRVVSNPSAGTYAYVISSGSPYAGGRRSTSADSGGTWGVASPSTDVGFRTYMKSGYTLSGTQISSVKDSNPIAGLTPVWTTLSWNASTPAGTSLKFQVAASNFHFGPFGPSSFVGPDGTAATFFTTSGASLAQVYGFRYLQYKAYLATTDSTKTPTLNDVTVCYADTDCSGTISITPTPAQVSPNSTGNTASGPAGATSYAWSITNGSITAGTTSQTVTYTAGASGSVGLLLNIVDAAGCHKSGSTNVTIGTTPVTPTNVVATATAPTSVSITWIGQAGATWEVLRIAAGGVSSTIGTSTSGALTDTTASANTAYLYKVRQTIPSVSPYSTPDLATTVIFTDPTLTPGSTIVKAAHFTELRTAVNAVRALAGLGAGVYTDPTLSPGLTLVRALHLTDLRGALDAARGTLLLPAVSYTRSSIVAGTTTIAVVDINDLRGGVR
jgi:hypothetical protein